MLRNHYNASKPLINFSLEPLSIYFLIFMHTVYRLSFLGNPCRYIEAVKKVNVNCVRIMCSFFIS